MKTKVKLIGGPEDGKELDVLDDYVRLVIPVLKTAAEVYSRDVDAPETDFMFDEAVYNRRDAVSFVYAGTRQM